MAGEALARALRVWKSGVLADSEDEEQRCSEMEEHVMWCGGREAK